MTQGATSRTTTATPRDGERAAHPITTTRYHHAEGPVYDDRTGELAWVDIYAGNVHVAALDPASGELSEPRTYAVGRSAGALAPCEDPDAGWVVAGTMGFLLLGRHGAVEPLAQPEAGAVPETRMNDGKCDLVGGFWAGSMGWGKEHGAGRLFRLDPDGTCDTVLVDVTISNGLAWVDDRTVHFVDTPTHGVDLLRYDLDGARVRVVSRARAFDIPPELGAPDGMSVDAEGYLWIALWGGGSVGRFAPDGRLLERVTVDASQVSSCTFAGPDLRTLVITTSQEGFTSEQSAAEPSSGRLFAARVDVPGLAVDRFAAQPSASVTDPATAASAR